MGLTEQEFKEAMENYNQFLQDNQPEPAGGLLGWVCPKCGTALSPFVNYCVKCSGNWEITYNTGNAPQVGFYQTESNYNREQRERKD